MITFLYSRCSFHSLFRRFYFVVFFFFFFFCFCCDLFTNSVLIWKSIRISYVCNVELSWYLLPSFVSFVHCIGYSVHVFGSLLYFASCDLSSYLPHSLSIMFTRCMCVYLVRTLSSRITLIITQCLLICGSQSIFTRKKLEWTKEISIFYALNTCMHSIYTSQQHETNYRVNYLLNCVYQANGQPVGPTRKNKPRHNKQNQYTKHSRASNLNFNNMHRIFIIHPSF